MSEPRRQEMTEPTPSLSRALRRIAQQPRQSSLDVPILEDAADALESLTRERDNYWRERDVALVWEVKLRAQVQQLREALESLRNEAKGFLSMASVEHHGATNIRCMERRIEQAYAALSPKDKP